eukprot:8578048-Pyramimonas_sp.AAC.1
MPNAQIRTPAATQADFPAHSRISRSTHSGRTLCFSRADRRAPCPAASEACSKSPMPTHSSKL